VLHDFCADVNCEDGANPYSTLVRDRFGNLFGVTVHGGTTCVSTGLLGCGTVFGLLYNKTTKTYQHKVLHEFCKDQSGCADGSVPTAGLVADKDGNLYGVTSGGRTNGDYGTVFKMTPKNAARTLWTFKVLHKFCNSGDCADGTTPYGGLVIDSAGNLYGTTAFDGAHDGGVLFILRLNKSTGRYIYKVLHDFCAKPDCTDGTKPTLTLAIDNAGRLYGTTLSGGTHNNGGTVFKMTPNAAKTAWTYKVLHNFCTAPNCPDGNGPYTNLVLDDAGKLYGASMTKPGNPNGGSIFQLTPNAAKTLYTFKALHRFCTEINCADGTTNGSSTGLTIDGTGNLFLPILERGAHNGGSILESLND
jgi:uncharacterized repeat protein (TIGR03803 family)